MGLGCFAASDSAVLEPSKNFNSDSWKTNPLSDGTSYCSTPLISPRQETACMSGAAEAGEGKSKLPVCYDYKSLPPLHAAAFTGNLQRILDCVEGQNVDNTVHMVNNYGRVLCGVTPLFLAAQCGHLEACKLLVDKGANPNQPVYIQNSADLCTPRQVALHNIRLLVFLYLTRAASIRKKQDKALKEDTHAAVKAQKHNNTLFKRSNLNERRSQSLDLAGAGAQDFMMRLSDLNGWNPSTEDPHAHNSRKHNEKLLSKMDFRKWRPDRQWNKQGNEELATSSSRLVDPSEIDDFEPITEPTAMDRFLQANNFMQWIPEGSDEEEAGEVGGKTDMSSSRCVDSRRTTDDGTHSSSSGPLSWPPAAGSLSADGTSHQGSVESPVAVTPAASAGLPSEEGLGPTPEEAAAAAGTVTSPTAVGMGTGGKARGGPWGGDGTRASARAAAAAGTKWAGVPQTAGADMARGAYRWCASRNRDDRDVPSASVAISSWGGPGPYVAPPSRFPLKMKLSGLTTDDDEEDPDENFEVSDSKVVGSSDKQQPCCSQPPTLSPSSVHVDEGRGC